MLRLRSELCRRGAAPDLAGWGAAAATAAGGAGAASGVTNTAVTTTQEHMKTDKGQVCHGLIKIFMIKITILK